ncbi:MAG: CPBP family intramembrane glutamic endopeptidase [Candidatus Peribacteraceae bacterium]|jgi:membrane protease YdiL (CAAX protease family)
MKFANTKFFLCLFLPGMAGAVAVVPYAFSTIGVTSLEQPPLPLENLVTIQILMSALVLAAAIWIGRKVSRRVGLGAPYVERLCGVSSPSSLYPQTAPFRTSREVFRSFLFTVAGSVFLGAGVVALAVLLDFVIFGNAFGASLSRGVTPVWQRSLAVLYGGIDEEILMRYFVLSTVAWVLHRAEKRTEGGLSAFGRWTSIVVTALIFGVGHLPFAAEIAVLDWRVIARVLLLNGAAATVFGWIYWRRGLEAAVVAHATSDALLLVALPWAIGRMVAA